MAKKHLRVLAGLCLVLVGCSVLISSCTLEDGDKELFSTPVMMTLKIEGQKVGGKYNVLVLDPPPKQKLQISSIEGFDTKYEEGTEYVIKVKKIISKESGESNYIFVEEVNQLQ